MDNIKTGKELLDLFFSDLKERTDLDQQVIDTLSKLYAEGKITDKLIYNELEAIRRNLLNENSKSQITEF